MRTKISFLFVLCLAAAILITGCGNGNGKDGNTEKAVYEKMVDVVDRQVKIADLDATTFKAKVITSMTAYANKLWVGSNNGLQSYDGNEWRLFTNEKYNSLGSNKIISFAVNSNILWVATDNGACYSADGDKFSSIFTGGKARSCFGNDTSSYFVGTANGIVLSDGTTLSKSSNSGIVSNDITAINGNNGFVLIGTREGLIKYESGSVSSYKGPAKSLMGSSLIEVPANPANCKLPSNNIKCIIPFGAGQYAIGTTCGLAITNLNDEWKVFRTDYDDFVQRGAEIKKEKMQGNVNIPSNIINCLAKTEDNEVLFVGTTYGLTAFDSNGNVINLSDYVNDLPLDFDNAVIGLACLNNNLYIAQRNNISVIKNIKALIPAKKS